MSKIDRTVLPYILFVGRQQSKNYLDYRTSDNFKLYYIHPPGSPTAYSFHFGDARAVLYSRRQLKYSTMEIATVRQLS